MKPIYIGSFLTMTALTVSGCGTVPSAEAPVLSAYAPIVPVPVPMVKAIPIVPAVEPAGKRIDVQVGPHGQGPKGGAGGVIQLFEGSKLVKEIYDFSVGKPGHSTPEVKNGALDRTRRYIRYTSKKYNAPMPYALFWGPNTPCPGCAFHVGKTDGPSHGCVRLTTPDAKWLNNWAGKDPVVLNVTRIKVTSTKMPEKALKNLSPTR